MAARPASRTGGPANLGAGGSSLGRQSTSQPFERGSDLVEVAGGVRVKSSDDQAATGRFWYQPVVPEQ